MVDYSRKAEILKCLKCLGEIQSKHVHDYVRCECGAISTDGGDEYARFGWKDGADFEILKEFAEQK